MAWSPGKVGKDLPDRRIQTLGDVGRRDLPARICGAPASQADRRPHGLRVGLIGSNGTDRSTGPGRAAVLVTCGGPYRNPSSRCLPGGRGLAARGGRPWRRNRAWVSHAGRRLLRIASGPHRRRHRRRDGNGPPERPRRLWIGGKSGLRARSPFRNWTTRRTSGGVGSRFGDLATSEAWHPQPLRCDKHRAWPVPGEGRWPGP